MVEIELDITEWADRWGDLVNRVTAGDHRVVLLAGGQPQAALVGVGDLVRLENADSEEDRRARVQAVLDACDQLREKQRQRYDAEGIELEDSVEMIHEMRLERADRILGLR